MIKGEELIDLRERLLLNFDSSKEIAEWMFKANRFINRHKPVELIKDGHFEDVWEALDMVNPIDLSDPF